MAAILRMSSAGNPAAVRLMLEAAPDRGPELRFHTQGYCTVGVRSSPDLNDGSIAAANGSVVALCGTIDNLDDLAARSRLGRGSAATPAELVLELFRELGDRTPNALRGSFSGVFTDGISIHAFRDHVGLAPLHYASEASAVYVASETGQVLAGSGGARAPDSEFFECMLYDRWEDETLTAIRGVRRVPQGCVLSAGVNGSRSSRYWRPEEILETLRLTSRKIQDRFDELMTQAVGRALTGHAVVALSGGIESTAIAAYAGPEYRRRWQRPLSAVSATYPALPGIDERAAVELVAAELGLQLHLFAPQVRPLSGLREWVGRSGPAPTSFSPPRELYLTVRDLGYRTILNGNYGELATDVGQPHFVRHLLSARRIGALRALARAERARRVPVGTIARQLAKASLPSAIAEALDHRRRPEGFGPDWLDPMRFPRQVPSHVPGRGAWRQAQLASFYVPRLQLEADELEQASMGVHVRWPWLDVDLLEFFLGLPAETKYPDLRPRKLFVRRLLRGRVPAAILDRTNKTVYSDAEMSWIDYRVIRDILHDPTQRIAGVDYGRLGRHLDDHDLPARDFRYVARLAAIHAFLEEFSTKRT